MYSYIVFSLNSTTLEFSAKRKRLKERQRLTSWTVAVAAASAVRLSDCVDNEQARMEGKRRRRRRRVAGESGAVLRGRAFPCPTGINYSTRRPQPSTFVGVLAVCKYYLRPTTVLVSFDLNGHDN